MSQSNKSFSRILVIDDEEDIREMVCEFIESPEYVIETAEDGEHALNVLMSSRFDIIITDIRMPNLNGMELVKKIKYFALEAKIIVVTGNLITGKESGLLKSHGVCEIMNKPVGRDELIEAVENALNAKKAS